MKIPPQKLPLFTGQRRRTRHTVTITIYRRTDRPHLYARSSSPQIGCIRRSTHTPDRDTAIRYAELLNNHLHRLPSQHPSPPQQLDLPY